MEPPPPCTNESAGYLMQLSVKKSRILLWKKRSLHLNFCTPPRENENTYAPTWNLGFFRLTIRVTFETKEKKIQAGHVGTFLKIWWFLMEWPIIVVVTIVSLFVCLFVFCLFVFCLFVLFLFLFVCLFVCFVLFCFLIKDMVQGVLNDFVAKRDKFFA